MNLGISSFTFGWAVGVDGFPPPSPMDENDLVDVAVKLGVRCLQIGDNLPLHKLTPERLESFRELIARQTVRLEVGARKLTPEHLQTYLNIAQSLNAPLLRFIIDGDGYEPDLVSVKSILLEFIPEIEKRKIILGIENHDRLKAVELRTLMEQIDSPQVGICLDCVNSLGAGEGLEHVVDMLGAFTVNLHIKDFMIKRLPHKMGFTVTGAPAGEGSTNIASLLEKISQYGRCQSAVLEQWVPPEEILTDTIEKERRWAEQGITYLKQFKIFKQKS